MYSIFSHIRSIRIHSAASSPGGYRRQLVPIAATSEPLNQPLCRDSWRATSCPFLRSLLLSTPAPLPLLCFLLTPPAFLALLRFLRQWPLGRPFYHHVPTFHSFHQSSTIFSLCVCTIFYLLFFILFLILIEI